MSDDIDYIFEVLAEEERSDTDRKHGEHILAAAEGAYAGGKSREGQDRALLDAISGARLGDLTQEGEPGEPDGDEAA